MNIEHLYQGTPNIGNRLRRTRKEQGLTQEQLAAQCGSKQAVIQKIENGKSLRPRQIEEIAEILGVNPAWLQFGDPWAGKNRPE